MQEFAVLLFVFAHCSGAAEVGISILGLMRQSGWKVATVSKLVSTLEANGYVSSAPNPKDLRSRLVSITTKGERLARSGRNPPWGGLKNTPDKDQT